MAADKYPYECGVWKATANHSREQIEAVIHRLKRDRRSRFADEVRTLEAVMEALRPERVEAFVDEWYDKPAKVKSPLEAIPDGLRKGAPK